MEYDINSIFLGIGATVYVFDRLANIFKNGKSDIPRLINKLDDLVTELKIQNAKN